MVDAVSGTIYVIGGWDSITYYNDVWASTDGGARAGLGRGGGRGVHRGGTTGVRRGTIGGTKGYSRGFKGVV